MGQSQRSSVASLRQRNKGAIDMTTQSQYQIPMPPKKSFRPTNNRRGRAALAAAGADPGQYQSRPRIFRPRKPPGRAAAAREPTRAETKMLAKESIRMEMSVQSIYERVRSLASGNAVVIFTLSGCCMCHVVKQLLFGLGVGPTIVELDRDAHGREIYDLLLNLPGSAPGQQQPVPAVFVGGRFLGGIDTVMGCHINGTLVPLLKDAGALWL
nr:glutaredoxin-C9-like [Ipomoea batatas]